MFSRFTSYVSSFFYSTTEKDFTKATFDRNSEADRKSLVGKIDEFNSTYVKLLKSDFLNFELPIGIDLFIIFNFSMSILSQLLLCSGYSAYFYISGKYQANQDLRGAYQDQLNTLLAIYHNSVKQYGPSITSNETIIQLLRTIAPFVATKDLLFGNLLKSKELSEEFIQILSESPHRVSSALLNDGNEKVAEAKPATFFGQLSNNKWYALFNHSKAEVRKTLYGRRSLALENVEEKEPNKSASILSMLKLT